jgi:hypothetical protein
MWNRFHSFFRFFLLVALGTKGFGKPPRTVAGPWYPSKVLDLHLDH